MNWSDERYVKLYVRDTLTWLSLPFEARAVLALMMRKVDGAGVLETGTFDPVVALAMQIVAPVDLVRIGLAALMATDTVEKVANGLLLTNFVDAQEATKTETQKKRDQRSRSRDQRRFAQVDEIRTAPVPDCPVLSPTVPHCPPPAQPSPAQPTTSPPPPPAQPSPAQPKKPKSKPQAELPDMVPPKSPKPPTRIGKLWEAFQEERRLKITSPPEEGGLGLAEVPPDEPPDWPRSAATLAQWVKLWPNLTAEQVDGRMVVVMDEWLTEPYWASTTRDGAPCVPYPWGAFITERQWRRSIEKILNTPLPGEETQGGVH